VTDDRTWMKQLIDDGVERTKHELHAVAITRAVIEH
jgi:hypothetical protein